MNRSREPFAPELSVSHLRQHKCGGSPSKSIKQHTLSRCATTLRGKGYNAGRAVVLARRNSSARLRCHADHAGRAQCALMLFIKKTQTRMSRLGHPF